MHFKSAFRLLVFAFIFTGAILITGCSSSVELSKEGMKEHPQVEKSGVTEYTNSSELVITNTSSVETNLTEGNLESLTSSLAGSLTTSDLNYSYVYDELMSKIIEYINTPYLYGGTSKSGIDCSAFVQTVIYQAFGIALPRTSLEQSTVGQDVNIEDLQFGDLLFFDTMSKGRVSHVGIYLKDGYFAHSGSRTGVAIADLRSDYYTSKFLKAKRIF